MTDMEILQLADQCGVIAVTKHEWDGKQFNHTDDYLDGDGAALIIFAKEIAKHEREACAGIADYKLDNKGLTAPDSPKEWWNHACQNIRDAIRARGKA